MKTSTEISSAARIIGEERAIELIAKAGFSAWDFSMFAMCDYDWGSCKATLGNHPLAQNNYLKFARKLKQIGLDNGIECNQSHAPFPSNDSLILSCLQRAVECTAEAGGKICVIHPDNNKGPSENAEMYEKILSFAKECGVKIATENMFNWDPAANQSCFAACATAESFNAHLNAVHDENFVACLDIGHAELYSSGDGAVKMIKALGNKLQALHIHDNDHKGDCHQIPFSMQIDFSAVVKALKEINYTGFFTLEANSYLNKYTPDNVSDGINDLARSARKLADMFENA